MTSCSPSFDTLGVFANSHSLLAKVAQILFKLEVHDNTWNKVYLLEDAFNLLTPLTKKAFISAIDILTKSYPNKIESISLSRICPNNTLESCSETFSILKNIEAWKSFGSWCLENNFPFSDPIKESFEFISKIDPGLTSEKLILRAQIRNKMNTFLGPKNILCIPTASEPAPLLTTSREELKNLEYAKKTLQLCSLACIADLCQVTIPCIKDSPIGLSFLMSNQNDAALLMYAQTFDNMLRKS